MKKNKNINTINKHSVTEQKMIMCFTVAASLCYCLCDYLLINYDNDGNGSNNKDYINNLVHQVNHKAVIRPSSMMMSSSPQPSPASEISTSM